MQHVGYWRKGALRAPLVSKIPEKNFMLHFLGPDDLGMRVVGPAGPEHDQKAPKRGTAHAAARGDVKQNRYGTIGT